MPTAATSQNGPQGVAPYEYPRGQLGDGPWERIYRSAWVTDNITTPDVVHTLEVTDGKGGLPIIGQPQKIEVRVEGIVQYHTKVTLTFRRRIGQTGPYQELGPTLDPPPGPGQPHTQAQ